MKYRSTRGRVTGLTFEDALFSGYLEDGGICLPDQIPQIDKDTLKSWSSLSYPEITKNVMSLYLEGEIPREKINEMVDKAFGRFTIEEVVGFAPLKDDLNILEMFHGPTLAFKDLALSIVGQMMEFFLSKNKKHITLIVATSGDTGSAAIDSVRGSKYIDLIVLLPRGRTALVQELQMTTVIEENIHVYRADGTSDDMDVSIKNVFMDPALVKKHNLGSINSINFGRILIQIAHYFYAYFKLRPDCDGEAEIAIPTGACGNVTSGVIAKQMGLPVHFVCTVNTNDIVARTMANGDFSKSAEVAVTLAPAMDIQMPYNIERLLYIYSGGDTELVNRVLDEIESTGKAVLPEDVHKKMKADISSYVVNNEGIKSAMKRCWDDNKYLLCPHTAVATYYHYHNRDCSSPRICFATASPAKFEEAVKAAGLSPQPTDSVKALYDKPTKYIDLEKSEDWAQILREKLEKIYENIKA